MDEFDRRMEYRFPELLRACAVEDEMRLIMEYQHGAFHWSNGTTRSPSPWKKETCCPRSSSATG
eukprot:10830011-Heterocapsa_arctica.AAC.1